MQTKVLLPYAPILVESTRSIGYSFEAALADIVDNSISKECKNININFSSLENPYIAIIDDGCGMSNEQLESAMRYGSKSSLDIREENDLGRFGLGLKMASLSQCRKLTVVTKYNGIISAACWDLDYIIEQGNWSLLKYESDEISEIPHIDMLKAQNSGTLVLWQNFDRIVNSSSNFQKAFDERISISQDHLALVFHRFTGDENISNRINIFFNNDKVTPVDPFLTNNPATQPLNTQKIRILDSAITVKPYILPFISKLSSNDKKLLGDPENLRQSQGFYIYRNKRLIIWGTWFRLIKKFELNKLARIKVDIPNTLDSIWEIDIKKSAASLPEILKEPLRNVVQNTVGRSEKVYKYRGRKVKDDQIQHVWDIVDDRGSFQYKVNREIPLIKSLEESLDQQGQRTFDSILKMIEDTFPYGDVYYRLAKKENSHDSANLKDDEAYNIAIDSINSLKEIDGDINIFISTMQQNDFFMKYPNVVKKIKEDFDCEC